MNLQFSECGVFLNTFGGRDSVFLKNLSALKSSSRNINFSNKNGYSLIRGNSILYIFSLIIVEKC